MPDPHIAAPLAGEVALRQNMPVMTSLFPASAPELIAYEQALDLVLPALSPVAVQPVPLAQAQGRVAAPSPAHPTGLPSQAVARIDGWACRALDLVGAGPLAPVLLPSPPHWVEVGQPLPAGCDAMLAPDLIEDQGPIRLAMGEALPGENTIRPGDHLAPGQPVVPQGQRIGPADILLAAALGLETLPCRSPRIRVIDVGGAAGGPGLSARFIQGWLARAGAQVAPVTCCAADHDAIRAAILSDPADLIVTIGGTGRGRLDATLPALAGLDRLVAPHIGLASAMSAAMAWAGCSPVIALPGAPDGTVTGCLALLDPVMRRLCDRAATLPLDLPLLRKISSAVGLAELVLLARRPDGWLPLATGRLSLDQLRRADGWVVVPSGDEGYPAGAMIGALPLWGWD